MIYKNPGEPDALLNFKPQYENYIGGQWVAPVNGVYFENITPVTGAVICQIPRSTEADINLALDAAHEAKS
nr:aldehyde dehydrogenase [Endozoicomonas sp.]